MKDFPKPSDMIANSIREKLVEHDAYLEIDENWSFIINITKKKGDISVNVDIKMHRE